MRKVITACLLLGASAVNAQTNHGLYTYTSSNPKTVSKVIIPAFNAIIPGIMSSGGNYSIIYTSCDFILQNHYDEIDACNADFECSKSIPFPSTTQPLLQVFGAGFGSAFNDNYQSSEVKPVKQAFGECKFEPRTHAYSNRSEKAWTKVLFSPTHSYWDPYDKKFLSKPQSVVTSTPAASMGNANLGVWSCGPDGVSSVTDGAYKQPSYLLRDVHTNVTSAGQDIQDLEYIIAGWPLSNLLGVYTAQPIKGREAILSQFKGELHESTPMIAGECNTLCIDPAYEVYSNPTGNSGGKKLTEGAAEKGSWYVKKFTKFASANDALPSRVRFTDESAKPERSVNEFGQTNFEDYFIPGGALFGYSKQEIWIR